ncbi:tetratricopeptide repeat protein [Winogradskyella sp.]|uniref:tetratricopeptide repeat protein n=1 Tax=Winogradskyella sp. TaxID=1883156 RepID=UPI003BAB05B8
MVSLLAKAPAYVSYVLNSISFVKMISYKTEAHLRSFLLSLYTGRCIVLYGLVLLSFHGFAQEQNRDTTLIRLKSTLENAQDDDEKLKALMTLGEYQIEYNIKQAETYLTQARQLAEANKVKLEDLAFIYNQLGVVNRRKAAYDIALELYLKSKDIYEKIKDTSNMADVIHNIGLVYRYQEQDSIAVKNFEEAIRLNKRMKDTFSLAAAYNMIGVSYRRMKQFDSALVNYERARNLFELLESEEDVRGVDSNLAVVYSRTGQFDKSLPIKLASLDYYKSQGKKMSICVGYYSLSTEYSRLGSHEIAKKYADSSLQIALNEGYKERIATAYVRRSAAYRDMKNFEEAYSDYRLFKKYSDSVYGRKSAERIKELELQYQLEKERNELEILSEERKHKIRLYIFLFLLAIVVGGLVGYLLWKNYKARVRIVADQLEKEKLKKELLDEKVKVSEAELKLLAEQIAANEKDLTNYTQQLLAKSQEQEALTKEMETLRSDMGTQITIPILQELANSKILTSEDWRNFKHKFNLVYPDFFKNITENGFQPTTSEERLLSLEKLELDSKEIANMLGISFESVMQSRYRLRKKWDVPKDISILEFLGT